MKYDQVYYSWLPENGSGLSPQKGLGVKFSSNFDENFLKVWNLSATNKKPELTSRGLVTEYFQYVDPLKTFAYLGVIEIDSLPEMKGRKNHLVHIFTPAEEINLDQPSSYIRKPEYTRLHALSKDICLEQVEFPDCNFDYQTLLCKYNLTDCTRLAMLLSMEFSGYFEDSKRAIVFPIDPDGPDALSETAREITWLLHSWVPNGISILEKSALDLKKNLGYMVGADAKDKQCLCFIPRGGNTEKKQVFDLKKAYMKEELVEGTAFFLDMAQKAQESPEAVRNMIDEVCEPLADTRPALLSKIYNAYQYYTMMHTETLPVGFLSSKEEEIWRKKAIGNGNDSEMAVNYCVTMLYKLKYGEQANKTKLSEAQLKEYWNVLEKAYPDRMQRADRQPFEGLVADFVNMIFNYACKKKDMQFYIDKLELLKTDDSDSHEIWKKLYEEYDCIRKHLQMISENRADDPKGCLSVLEQCLSCYPGWICEQDFQDTMRHQTELLYETALESGNSELKEQISELVAQNNSVYDTDEWTRLELKTMDPACDEFLEKYRGLDSSVKPVWFRKAAEYLNTFQGKVCLLDSGLYRRYLQISSGESVGEEFSTEENYQAFCRALKALSEEGRKGLDFIRTKKNGFDKRVFYLFLYQSCSDSRGWDNPEIWTEIEIRNFNSFVVYRESMEKKEEGMQAVLEEMLSSSNPQAIRLRAYCGFCSGKQLDNAVLNDFSGLYKTEEDQLKTNEMFQKMRSWLWKNRPTGKGFTDSRWETACMNYQSLYLAVFSQKDYKRFYEDFHKNKKDEYLENGKFQEIFQKYIQAVRKTEFRRTGESFVENLEMYHKVRAFLEQNDNQKLSVKEAEEYAKICKNGFLESGEQSAFSSHLVKKAIELYLSKTEKRVLRRIESFMEEIDGWKSQMGESLNCDTVEGYNQYFDQLEEHPDIRDEVLKKIPGLEQLVMKIGKREKYRGSLGAFEIMAAEGICDEKKLERCMKKAGIVDEDRRMILNQLTESGIVSVLGSDNSSASLDESASADKAERNNSADGGNPAERASEKQMYINQKNAYSVDGSEENRNPVSIPVTSQMLARVTKVKEFVGLSIYSNNESKKMAEVSNKKSSGENLLKMLKEKSYNK